MTHQSIKTTSRDVNVLLLEISDWFSVEIFYDTATGVVTLSLKGFHTLDWQLNTLVILNGME